MIKKDENGNILIRQGDTGEIIFYGFNPDKNYYVYFAITDENRNIMFPEIITTTNNSNSVSIFLEADNTKKLTVPLDEETAIYYWALKYAEIGSTEENTIAPGFGGKCMILVYPQLVEGPI